VGFFDGKGSSQLRIECVGVKYAPEPYAPEPYTPEPYTPEPYTPEPEPYTPEPTPSYEPVTEAPAYQPTAQFECGAVACDWDKYRENKDWTFHSEYFQGSLKDCQEACAANAECSGLEYSQSDRYCSFWLGGACDIRKGDTQPVYYGTDLQTCTNLQYQPAYAPQPAYPYPQQYDTHNDYPVRHNAHYADSYASYSDEMLSELYGQQYRRLLARNGDGQ